MFETRREGDVVAFERPETDWLSTGWRGGHTRADRAISVSVPADWHPPDLDRDVRARVAATDIDLGDAPVLLTGVAADHVRGAHLAPVTVYATAGLANPAGLPMDPTGGPLPDGERVPGTVNLVVGTTRSLGDGAAANLATMAAEAKAATLLDAVGVPGTTTDAVVVGSDSAGELAAFTGSATRVGAATRVCVRDAVRAALAARYDGDPPDDVLSTAKYAQVSEATAEPLEL